MVWGVSKVRQNRLSTHMYILLSTILDINSKSNARKTGRKEKKRKKEIRKRKKKDRPHHDQHIYSNNETFQSEVQMWVHTPFPARPLSVGVISGSGYCVVYFVLYIIL